MKKKPVTIMLPTWVQKTGEALWDENMGVSKEKWLQKYARDAYMNSFTPGHLLKKKNGVLKTMKENPSKNKRKNPYTAKVRQDVWSMIPEINESLSKSAVKGNIPRSEVPLFYQRLKSAISNVIHMYLETELALDPSASFDFGRGESESRKKEILINRFYRDAVAVISIKLIEKLLAMDGYIFKKKLSELGLDASKPVNLLMDKNVRMNFVREMTKEVGLALSQIDFIKVLDQAIARREQRFEGESKVRPEKEIKKK